MATVAPVSEISVSGKTPLYATLWAQVLIAIVFAVALGYFNPTTAIAMKPLGDGFIKLMTMIITAVIFCTVVSGMAEMHDINKGAPARQNSLLFFFIVSTLSPLPRILIS